MTPTKLGLFWTQDRRSWWGPLIDRITGRDGYAHTGVLFSDGADCVYYEALVGKGVSGPTPWANLIAFAQKPARNFAWTWLDVSPAQTAAALQECLVLQRFAGYSVWQLLGMWAREKVGWKFKKDETRIVCSELTALVCAKAGVNLCDDKHVIEDYVTPNSSFRTIVAMGYKPWHSKS